MDWENKCFLSTAYTAGGNGWTQSEIFLYYSKETRSILIIYDGHSTHVDIVLFKINDSQSTPPHKPHLATTRFVSFQIDEN